MISGSAAYLYPADPCLPGKSSFGSAFIPSVEKIRGLAGPDNRALAQAGLPTKYFGLNPRPLPNMEANSARQGIKIARTRALVQVSTRRQRLQRDFSSCVWVDLRGIEPLTSSMLRKKS